MSSERKRSTAEHGRARQLEMPVCSCSHTRIPFRMVLEGYPYWGTYSPIENAFSGCRYEVNGVFRKVKLKAIDLNALIGSSTFPTIEFLNRGDLLHVLEYHQILHVEIDSVFWTLYLRFPHEIISDLRQLPSMWSKTTQTRLFREIIACLGIRDRVRLARISSKWKNAVDVNENTFPILCDTLNDLKSIPTRTIYQLDHLVLRCSKTDLCTTKSQTTCEKAESCVGRQHARELRTFLLANPQITTLTLANCDMEDVGGTNQLTVAVRCPEEDFWSAVKSVKFYNSTLTLFCLAPTVSWDWTIFLPNGRPFSFQDIPLCKTLRRRVLYEFLQEHGCIWPYPDEQLEWLTASLALVKDGYKDEILGYLRTNPFRKDIPNSMQTSLEFENFQLTTADCAFIAHYLAHIPVLCKNHPDLFTPPAGLTLPPYNLLGEFST